MRRRSALLAVLILAVAGRGAWAAETAAVTAESVAADVATCDASKPEEITDFVCHKPGGAVTGDTFIQVAMDRQFRAVDERVMGYLAALKAGVTAQPVEFAHSVLACFDATAPAKVPPACVEAAADGSKRNFTASYAAACDRVPGLAAAAVSVWNGKHPDRTLVLRSDGDLKAVLAGEGGSDGSPSCRGVADRKIAAYKAVANLLARDALQSGYDRARQAFVSKISGQYVALLQKLQRLVTKLDLINDKWKNRTKNTYSQ